MTTENIRMTVPHSDNPTTENQGAVTGKSGRKKIAFGPMVGLPSTEWVGRDVAEYLSIEHDVTLFDSFTSEIEADFIIIIKIIPSLNWIIQQKKKGARVIYMPVDFFSSPSKFEKEGTKLSVFDAICTHNSRFKKYLSRHNQNIYFIDHYLKYRLTELPTYKRDGYILWIGHMEYIPSLIAELEKFPIKHPIRCLTDLENLDRHRPRLELELKRLGINFSIEQKSDKECTLCGLKLEQWSEQRQAEYMMGCKAAFDTKDNNFSHNNKPPTKAQQYIFNNIPFATEKHSYSYHYFHEKGLKIPSLSEQDYWFSDEYYKAISGFISTNRNDLSLECIANSYIQILNDVEKVSLSRTRNMILLNISNAMDGCKALLSRITQRSENNLA